MRDAIRDLLLGRKLKTVHVDIYDCNRRFFPKRFSMAQDHPVAIQYSSVKEDIVRLLRKKIDLPWQSVCLYQVGKSLDQATPCIVISVSPGATHNWASLRRQILDMFGSANIDVEFLPELKKKSTESRV
jgi:hypothetical protein